MPSFLLLSDLHLEFSDFQPPDRVSASADAVILAGDIGPKAKGLRWAKERLSDYEAVFYVPGNHEYYGDDLDLDAKLRQEAQGSNVHFLNRDCVEFRGVRIIGATLWTDFRLTGNQPIAMFDAQQSLNDYARIRTGSAGAYRKIRPDTVLALHMADRRFIEDQLAIHFEGKTVIVTHHAPCEQSVHPRYTQRTESHLNSAYASRLDRMMGQGIDVWCHGHTHDSFDYDVYGTRVLCNPRGYVSTRPGSTLSQQEGASNPTFSPRMVFSV